jgi:hypothetical protein
LNADGRFSPADVVLELNCVFLSSANCPLDRADLNCDGIINAVDAAHVLNRVFYGMSAICP